MYNKWNKINTGAPGDVNTKSWRYIENNIILQTNNEIYKDRIHTVSDNWKSALEYLTKEYMNEKTNYHIIGKDCSEINSNIYNYCDFSIIQPLKKNGEQIIQSSRTRLYNLLNQYWLKDVLNGKGLGLFNELYTSMTRPDSLIQLMMCYLFSLQVMMAWYQEVATVNPFIDSNTKKWLNPWKNNQIGNINKIGLKQDGGTLLGEIQTHIINIIIIYRYTNELIASKLYIKTTPEKLPCKNIWNLYYYDEKIYQETGYESVYNNCIAKMRTYFNLTDKVIKPISNMLQLSGMNITNWNNKDTITYPKYNYVQKGKYDTCWYSTTNGNPSIEKSSAQLNISYDSNGGYPFGISYPNYKDAIQCLSTGNCNPNNNFYQSTPIFLDEKDICENNANLIKIKNYPQNNTTNLLPEYKNKNIYKKYINPTCPIGTKYAFTALANGLSPEDPESRYLVCQKNDGSNEYATECSSTEEVTTSPPPMTTINPVTTPNITTPIPKKNNLMWAIVDIMAITNTAWNSKDFVKDDWVVCRTNQPTNVYIEDENIPIQDLNESIGGPVIYLAVKYAQVDNTKNIWIVRSLRTGKTDPQKTTLCNPLNKIRVVGFNDAAGIISQTYDTTSKCKRFQGCCVSGRDASSVGYYVKSIAVTKTRNSGPITNLNVTMNDPNDRSIYTTYNLNTICSQEDMHLSCGDDYSLYIVAALVFKEFTY